MRQLAAVLLVTAIGSLTVNAQDAEKAPARSFDWMPPQSVDSSGAAVDITGQLAAREIIITHTPKATAYDANFTNVYEIDLKKFNISNDGTHPVETSKGINEALQHSKTLKANRIVFPKGTYLISENDPVSIDLKNAIIDFNGATLKINTNGLVKYTIVQTVLGAENIRLTNGILRGDRDDHDYKTNKGTHEHGTGLRLQSGVNIEVDHMLFTETTGDGVTSESFGGPKTSPFIYMVLKAKQFEQGNISDKGLPIAGDQTVRTIEMLDLAKFNGQYEFGYSWGYQGYFYVRGRAYQTYYYDANKKYIGKQEAMQYRKYTLPENAAYMHVVFNQPVLGGNAQGLIGAFSNYQPPREVHFHHNKMINNRRLGFAFCGGQQWLIEHNLFAENGGTAPAFGMDFEDGWDLMMDVVVRKNIFRDNQRGDLVICAGTEILVEDNDFEKTFATWGRVHNYTITGNRFKGSSVSYKTRTGLASFNNNVYEGGSLNIIFDTFADNAGVNLPLGQKFSSPPLILKNETFKDMKNISGTYVSIEDSTLDNVLLRAGLDTKLIRLHNSKLTNTRLVYINGEEKVFVDIKGNKGEITEEGKDAKARRQDVK